MSHSTSEISPKEPLSIQCACLTPLAKGSYRLVLVRKELHEIAIFCPNPYCFLGELGFIKFKFNSDQIASFQNGKFYPPFVLANTSRLGMECLEILKSQLKFLVKYRIDWEKLSRLVGNLNVK